LKKFLEKFLKKFLEKILGQRFIATLTITRRMSSQQHSIITVLPRIHMVCLPGVINPRTIATNPTLYSVLSNFGGFPFISPRILPCDFLG
jgi:hypothetical protein